jgi:hypothetical protein
LHFEHLSGRIILPERTALANMALLFIFVFLYTIAFFASVFSDFMEPMLAIDACVNKLSVR